MYDDTLFNDIRRQLDLAGIRVDDQTSAETAILHLMNIFDIDVEKLKATMMSAMNDSYSVVLEWRLNTFSLRNGLDIDHYVQEKTMA